MVSKLATAIASMISEAIKSLKTLELSELRSFGNDILRIRHQSGAKIELKPDGEVYINGTASSELGGSGGIWTDGTSAYLTSGKSIDVQEFELQRVAKIEFDSGGTHTTGNYIDYTDGGESNVLTMMGNAAINFGIGSTAECILTSSGLSAKNTWTPPSDYYYATKKYVDDNTGSGTYLPLAGGTMAGAIDMAYNTLRLSNSSYPYNRVYASGTTTYIGANTTLGFQIGAAEKMRLQSNYLDLWVNLRMQSGVNIDMGNNYITNLATPTLDAQAANKGYVDNFMPLSGGTFTGTVSFNGNDISSVGNITASTDMVMGIPNGYNFKIANVLGDTFTFPTTDGTAGQALVTDSSGNLSFDDINSGLWQDDAANSHAELITPDDVSLNGYDLKDVAEIKGTSTGNLVLTIDDGYALVIQKQAL